MKIHITEEVRTLLPKDKHQFILTANDGSNPFSNSEGCCMIGDHFLFVGSDEIPINYTEKFQDGEDMIYLSPYDLNFISGNVELSKNPSTGMINLKNENGYLDDNLEIKLLY